MPRISEKGLPCCEAGVIHITTILPVIILIVGLVAALYLISNPTVLNPKADYKSDSSQAVSVNGAKCKDNICQIDSSNLTNIEISIDVAGLNSQ